MLKKKKCYKTHVSTKFISAVNALTYKTRASTTYKYIFEKRGIIKFDLFPNIYNIFLTIAKQEPQGMEDNTSTYHFVLNLGIAVSSVQQNKKNLYVNF